METCLNHEAPNNNTSVCQSLDTCTACVSTTSDCVWCHDHCTWSPACEEKEKRTYQRTEECVEAGLGATPKEWCGALHSCHSCSPRSGCTWESAKVSKCRETRRKTANVNLTEESGKITVLEEKIPITLLTQRGNEFLTKTTYMEPHVCRG